MKGFPKNDLPKKYSCVYCGTPFDAYPPDDKHDFATRNEKDYEDHIKVDYKCKANDCGKINTIYWGYCHAGAIAIGRFIK